MPKSILTPSPETTGVKCPIVEHLTAMAAVGLALGLDLSCDLPGLDPKLREKKKKVFFFFASFLQ